MTELKPCPHCNSDNVTLVDSSDSSRCIYNFYVKCNSCNASTYKTYNSSAIAIDVWNQTIFTINSKYKIKNLLLIKIRHIGKSHSQSILDFDLFLITKWYDNIDNIKFIAGTNEYNKNKYETNYDIVNTCLSNTQILECKKFEWQTQEFKDFLPSNLKKLSFIYNS